MGHWLYKENMQTYSEGVQQAKEADTEEGGGGVAYVTANQKLVLIGSIAT